MEKPSAGSTAPPPAPPDLVVRMIRHEVGDLLQTIYASVAILLERLGPELALERRILGDLRNRAQICRDTVDTVHDLVCPVSLTYDTVDAADVAAQTTSQAATRYPKLDVRSIVQPGPSVQADPRHLTQIARRLLSNACRRARREVCFLSSVEPTTRELSWTVTDDGPSIGPEDMAHLYEAFGHNRPGNFGLELGLVRKLVHLHGGTITASDRPEGGLAIQVRLGNSG